LVFGNLSTGYWLGAAAAGALHWQELDRVTLGGAGNDLDTSTFTTKPYMMVLANPIWNSGNPSPDFRFNADSGSNYARRISEGGGSDATATSQAEIYTDTWGGGASSGMHSFEVMNLSNISAQEKLITHHKVYNRAGVGAGSAPNRVEAVHKWANTSAQINRVQLLSSISSAFASGSELVVLGYDPADTEGGSIWEELGTTTLSSSSDTLDVSFTAKKYLMINWSTAPTGSDANPNGRCGIDSIDTGSNYAKRENSNGGSDSTGTSSSDLPTSIAGAGKHYGTIFCVNTSGQEKLMIGENIRDGGTGAGNAPDRKEWVAKYTITSGQINRWQIFNGSDTGGNDLAIGSTISVWGFD
jgi:hypothetical protein